MVYLTPYAVNSKIYEDYYCNQAGHGLSVFVGGRNQRGRGLGSLFGGVTRSLMPLLKSGGKALLQEGLRMGSRVAKDVLSGQSVKSAFQQRAKQSGKQLFNQAVGRVTGNRPPHKPIKRPTAAKPNQKNKKRRRNNTAADIFG